MAGVTHHAGPTAGQVWWWQRYAGGLAGPTTAAPAAAPAAFPQSALPVAVDLFMFDNWVEVTRLTPTQAGVYARDTIQISRGRSAEGADVDPTSLRFTLNNRDGRYSPRNPLSPLYGQIGRNTPARVRIGSDIRATAEVPAWPSRWDVTGSDVWVQVDASGILRRLSQGASVIRSPIYRWILSGTVATLAGVTIGEPVAYWPAEDTSGATQLASAVGGAAISLASTSPTLADNSDFPGSDPIPTLADSRWTGAVPTYDTSAGTSTVGLLLSVPSAGATNGSILLRLRTTGTAARFDLAYFSAAGGQLQVLAYDAAGANIFSSGGFAATSVNGNPMQIGLRLQQVAGNITIWLSFAGVFPGDGAAQTDGPIVARTVGRITVVQVNPNGNLDQVGVGHISVWDNEASLAFAVDATSLSRSPLEGYFTETAGTRIARLCLEEEIAFVRVQPQYPSSAMGVQHSGALVDLLRECASTDQGILFEPRTFLGLAYVGRKTLYNRLPALTLDYPSHQLSTMEPVDDDQLTRNDITVTRVNGSSARRTLESGALSVQAPPDGVGRYDTSVTINPESDTDLADQAGWRLHLGTVDEARYPTVTLNLANPAFTGNPDLTAAARALDIGQRLVITNPPPWMPPEDITLATQGFTETINAFEHTITVNSTPESPWQVGVYNSGTTAGIGADPGFEAGTNGAVVSGFFGGPAPTAAQSTLHAPQDSHSLLVTWGTGGQGLVSFTCTGLAVGQTYTVYCDAYVPAGSPDVSLGVAGVTFGDQISTKDTGFVLAVTWQAISTADQVQVIGQTPAGAGTTCYLDALGIYDHADNSSRYSPDSTILAAAAGAADTSLSMFTEDGPDWTTDITACPFDVRVGGERIRVRYVEGSAAQSFTAVRAINGIVKPQPAGAVVELWRPAVYAL